MQTTQQLGRYEILAEVGRGAMGAVFRARDPKIDRIVAIKTIAVPETDTEKMEQYRLRFIREAQAAGRLSHPGIVTIFDVEEDGPSHAPFIVMEYAEGLTLNNVVAHFSERKLPPSAALDLLEQIASALDYAHSAGIVHRDIKPANIIVTPEGHTKIMDFGIARTALSELTVTGHVLGTPAYMSPEQINGKPVDGRADIFSLGVIAYWLLTGVKPFDGETVTEICVQIAGKEPRRASELCTGLSTDFDYVLARAMAKEPARRYQRARELAADLHDLNSGQKPRSQFNSSPSAGLQSHPSNKTILLSEGTALAAKTSLSDAREQSDPSSAAQRRNRTTRRMLVIACFALFLVLGGAAIFALVSSRFMPATLQVVGRYPFHSGEIYIWVDGDLRYHDALRDTGQAHSHLPHRSHSAAESLAVTLPVRAGRHTVRVQVDAPGQTYDHDTAIPGDFRAYTQRTLMVDFGSANLNLRWD